MADNDSREHLREQLYEVMDDDELSEIEKQRQALSLGRTFLDVTNGHIQRQNSDGATDEIAVSVGDDPALLPEGTTLDRPTTYCRRTVESYSPIALSHASEQGWDDDPAYIEHGFECYLGTTILVEGEIYGTVCFISRESREKEFTPEEKAFVELLARLLGRDIEARRADQRIEQVERAKERLERKYESFIHRASDAILFADVETATITEVNEKAAELTGYTQDELREMSIPDLHPSEDREQYANLFENAPWDAPRSEFEDGTHFFIRRADGSDVPVEISVVPVTIDERDHVFGIVRDISSRRQRQRDLRVKNHAIDESTVGITIGDATEPDIPIMYANKGFTELTGYPLDRILGENCRFLQGEDTDETTVDEIRAAVNSESPIRTEILNYRKDGTPFWNRLTIAPVTGEETDSVTHFVGVQDDITEKKRRERLIEVLNRVLRHNLGNDLNVISGLAGEIVKRTEGETAQMARRIQQKSDQLTALSQKARKFQNTVTKTNPPAPRDLLDDLHTVVTGLQDDFPDTEFSIEGKADENVLATGSLPLVLAELGENAAKHGDSSPVTYRVNTTSDGRVAVDVIDNGPGLPAMEQQVLEAGRETPLNHGSGIGLWLVKWVITGLGGEVNTSVNDGTTVTIRLPLAVEGTVPPTQNSALSTYKE